MFLLRPTSLRYGSLYATESVTVSTSAISPSTPTERFPLAFPHIDALPIDDALTKLTSVFPEPISLLPNVLRADLQLDTVTACLWTSELEMDVLAGWMAKWPGAS